MDTEMDIQVPANLLQLLQEGDVNSILMKLFDAKQELLWCWASSVLDRDYMLRIIQESCSNQTVKSLWPCLRGIAMLGGEQNSSASMIFNIAITLYFNKECVLWKSDTLARLVITSYCCNPTMAITRQLPELLLTSDNYIKDLYAGIEGRYYLFYTILETLNGSNVKDKRKLLLKSISHCIINEYYDDAITATLHYGVLSVNDSDAIKSLLSSVKEISPEKQSWFFDELKKKALFTEIGTFRTLLNGDRCVVEIDGSVPSVIVNKDGVVIKIENCTDLKHDNNKWKLINDPESFKMALVSIGKTDDEYKIKAVTDQVYGELWSSSNERCGLENSNGKFYYSDDAEFSYPKGTVQPAYPSLFFLLLQLWKGKYDDSITDAQWEIISEVQPNFR